jgi:hypothetical protein
MKSIISVPPRGFLKGRHLRCHLPQVPGPGRAERTWRLRAAAGRPVPSANMYGPERLAAERLRGVRRNTLACVLLWLVGGLTSYAWLGLWVTVGLFGWAFPLAGIAVMGRSVTPRRENRHIGIR